MKRLLSGALSTVVLMTTVALVPGFKAQAQVLGDESIVYEPRTEAFEVAYLAYQGYLKEEGIESYAVLVQDYRQNEVEAEDVVRAAVQANYLSSDALDSEEYLDAVDWQLRLLERSSHRD
ncbi:MAG: hypothetical protein VKK04_23840 [Synechococcales bacterium]|nr:hypothetical protein [Synechococcales bacterium]